MSAAHVTELMTELSAAGVRLWPEGGALRYQAPQGAMTAARKAAVVAHKAELHQQLVREVQWRVEAMRSQVPATGAMPLLVARPIPGLPLGQVIATGRCLSCGDPALKRSARCGLCIAAVHQVIADVLDGRAISPRSCP